jgi:hypothetical protein
MAMFATKTTVALIAIVIASSLIFAGGGIIGSGVAAAKKESQKSENDNMYKILSSSQAKSDSEKSQSINSGDLSGDIGNTNGLSTKELKKLSKCQSSAAEDGDITLGEIKDCYSQLSAQGQQVKDQ